MALRFGNSHCDLDIKILEHCSLQKPIENKDDNTADDVFCVKPMELIKTKEFYIVIVGTTHACFLMLGYRYVGTAQHLMYPALFQLWFSYFANQICNGLFLSYSKSYGQIYISDDNFLAMAYTVSQVFNGSCRVVWGRMYDKFDFQVESKSICKNTGIKY